MALTALEIKQLVDDFVNTNPGWGWDEWNDETYKFGLHHKFDYQLINFQLSYENKLKNLYGFYKGLRDGYGDEISSAFVAVTSEDSIATLSQIKQKAVRLSKKWRAVNAEKAGRDAGVFGPGELFDRTYLGTTYYVDFDNGQDTRTGVNPDGLKTSDYTADSGTGTTTLVETSELARTVSGDWDGAYLYNVTRSAGALITNSVYSAGTWTMTHPTITGQVSGDTYYIIDAWLTLGQAVRITTLAASDIVYFRANTTHTPVATEEVDDDGWGDWIYMIGCDAAVNDPWGDGSNIKPIIDFGANAYQFYLYSDHGWRIERLHFEGSIVAQGQARFSSANGLYIDSCNFENYANAAYGGLTLQTSALMRIYNSAIVAGGAYGCRIESGIAYLEKCTFDGGAGYGADYGVGTRSGGIALLESCEFGQVVAFTDEDMRCNSGGKIYHRNCKYSTRMVYAQYAGAIIGEDDGETVGKFEMFTGNTGFLERNTTITRLGGGSSSVELTSEFQSTQGQTSPCRPLSISNSMWQCSNWYVPMWPYKRWMAASQHTVTFYIRAKGTWGTFPIVSELYLQASYYDHSSNATRTLISSNDVLSDISSTVDADSNLGQKVLNVAATTGFSVGDNIIIDEGSVGGGEEQGVIASIQAGVSLTLVDNLTYTHTAVQADVVAKEWFEFDVTFTPSQVGFVYFNIFLEKYVSGAGCYIDVEPVVS